MELQVKARRGGWLAMGVTTVLLAACGSGGPPATESDQPPGAPRDLWRAPSTSLPPSGNYVYLLDKSVAGREREFIYTSSAAVVELASANARLTVTVRGNESWFGEMQAPASSTRLAPAYHDGMQRFPIHEISRGGLQWWGLTALCDQLEGWFAVDAATYVDDKLTAVEARFEQRCPSGERLLGQLRWRADDATRPPGPQVIPAELWQPPVGRFPPSGNAVYVESDPADPLGQGQRSSYTTADAALWTESIGNYFSIHVRGDRYWDGQFKAMSHLPELRVGLYSDLRRYPFHNPAKGGLVWSDPRQLCNLADGWMAVDRIRHSTNGMVDAIELRFEQRCEGASGSLRGKVRWSLDDTSEAAGPQPVPPTLWRPIDLPSPTPGAFLQLASPSGDPVGGGSSPTLVTPAAQVSVDAAGPRLRWQVASPSTLVSAEFLTMDVVSRLEVGYYGGLRRPGVHNPTRGALTVQVDSRACLDVEGWVAVDQVAYVDNRLQSVDMRFEQRCADALEPLRGRFHWALPVTEPPTPVVDPGGSKP